MNYINQYIQETIKILEKIDQPGIRGMLDLFLQFVDFFRAHSESPLRAKQCLEGAKTG